MLTAKSESSLPLLATTATPRSTTTTTTTTATTTTIAVEVVPIAQLTQPSVSLRSRYPAHHFVADGVSPWNLVVSEEAGATVAAIRWSVVSFERSLPVADNAFIATDTPTVVEVTYVGHDGSATSMGFSECVLRTQLDDRSLADRQLAGQGWLLPLGYTVLVDCAAQ